MLFRRVLVTGATGFVGCHLVPALAPLAEELVLVSRRPRPIEAVPACRTVVEDLERACAAREMLFAVRPEIVFHLAGHRGRGEAGAEHCARLNVAATVELLEAARECDVRRIVLIGSAEEYGARGGQLAEDQPLAPVTPYGASKAAATQFALALARRGCPVVVVRPFTVYGPGQPAEMFLAEAIRCAVSGEPFQMTEGTQRRDLVYVDDLVSALIAVSRAADIEGRLFNVGGGEAHALRDVAKRVWEISDSRAPLLIGARSARPEETLDTWADVSRIREAVGWRPQISLEAGLARTIQAARAQQGSRCPA